MARITARIVRGHQVASGSNGDSRFPDGTLRMQLPHFLEEGLDLRGFHLATLNLSIAPARYEIAVARDTFPDLAWHPTEPAETFSFFDCRLHFPEQAEPAIGLIYYPHPETKPDHEQPPDVLEVILREEIPGVGYGDLVELETPDEQIRFHP